jgi:hypothetical protein
VQNLAGLNGRSAGACERIGRCPPLEREVRMAAVIDQDLPPFLRTHGDFSQHLEEHFEDLDPGERGDAFLAFALRLLPLSEGWGGLQDPTVSPKKSHDGGVDFDATTEDRTRVVHGQSKYKIHKVDEFDQVISKFHNHEQQYLSSANGQGALFADERTAKPLPHYIIVTSSKVQQIRKKYETSAFPSTEFFKKLVEADRIWIADGPELLETLKQVYRRSFIVPPTVEIELEAPYINIGNTYISVISARTLRGLYEQFGSSIFFENIREFLGVSGASPERENVNSEIVATLKQEPARMLERNNGITFKAEQLEPITDRKLRLTSCSIVNGCQTTMCVVKAGESEGASLLIKIVQAANSWDVAKAANHQNSVTRIDLDLARFLRPQLVRKIATEVGYGVSVGASQNAASVLEAIYQQKISYDEVRLLCLALFSRFPNNLFQSNYTELRIDILEEIDGRSQADYLLSSVFRLLAAMRRASAETQAVFSRADDLDLFKRIFREEKPQYRCFLAILAACGCTGEWLGEKTPDEAAEATRILKFLASLDQVLTTQPQLFDRAFTLSFLIVADKVLDASVEGRDAEILQNMWKGISQAPFNVLVRKLRLRMDSDGEIVRLRGGPQ